MLPMRVVYFLWNVWAGKKEKYAGGRKEAKKCEYWKGKQEKVGRLKSMMENKKKRKCEI